MVLDPKNLYVLTANEKIELNEHCSKIDERLRKNAKAGIAYRTNDISLALEKAIFDVYKSKGWDVGLSPDPLNRAVIVAEK